MALALSATVCERNLINVPIHILCHTGYCISLQCPISVFFLRHAGTHRHKYRYALRIHLQASRIGQGPLILHMMFYPGSFPPFLDAYFCFLTASPAPQMLSTANLSDHLAPPDQASPTDSSAAQSPGTSNPPAQHFQRQAGIVIPAHNRPSLLYRSIQARPVCMTIKVSFPLSVGCYL